MKIIFRFQISFILMMAGFSLLNVGCSDNDEEVKTPIIASFAPSSALPGAIITITGENFSGTAVDNQVAFNGVSADISSASSTQLVVIVPATATTGKLTVNVHGKTGTSSSDFTVLETTISGFAPATGVVGTAVTITGTNFSLTPSENIVKFNNVVAPITEGTATQLKVSVPSEATSGKITVTVSGTTVTSVENFIIPSPTISGFFPPIGAAGISVTIDGTNFSPILANNIVKFNGTAAIVTAASDTELTVTVPGGATTTGLLSVAVGPNTATSSEAFQVCFGSTELIISDVVVLNTSGSTSYTVSFKITNVGSENADVSKMSMQNYAAQDAQGTAAVAASGFGFNTAPILAPGQSYNTGNYVCNISGQNTTSRPYLMITLYDYPDGTVAECNYDNNTVFKPFNP
jgi:hypothetical protein